jgi:hypothetical protein
MNQRSDAVWIEVADNAGGRKADRLWLVVPDHIDELALVWLVMGVTPDDMWSVTIPLRLKNLPSLIRELSDLLEAVRLR